MSLEMPQMPENSSMRVSLATWKCPGSRGEGHLTPSGRPPRENLRQSQNAQIPSITYCYLKLVCV